MPSPPFPEVIGRYEILLPIASGGMATVYLALQRGAGGFAREVALKLTHAHLREQPTWAAELVEEAKLASRIAHPNVVQVIDVDDDPSGVFLVMPYIEGDTLSGLLKLVDDGQRLPAPIAFRILDDALAGLHAAHELTDDVGEPVGLVHRDFSPQNVLVGIDGVAHLADFGVAKAADRVGHTRTGTIKGKFGYMSPEQVRDATLDRRSDVWAAGVVAWELLAGQRMFPSADHASTLVRILMEAPPRVRDVRPDAPAALDDAIASALTIDVRRRCATAEELRRRLQDAFIEEVGELADRSEVARYVKELVTPKLVERRAKIAELRAAREQTGTRASLPLEGAPPASEGATEASLVTETTEKTPRGRSLSRAVVPIALGMAAAATLIGWRVVATSRGAPHAAAAVSSIAPSEPATAAASTTATPTATATATATATTSADPTASASAKARAPSARPPRDRSTAPRSAGASKNTTANPYATPTATPTATATPTPTPTATQATPPKLHESPYD